MQRVCSRFLRRRSRRNNGGHDEHCLVDAECASASAVAAVTPSARFVEFQRGAIHAVAQPGGFRPVVEHMAEMGFAARAKHLGAAHEEAAVFALLDIFFL